MTEPPMLNQSISAEEISRLRAQSYNATVLRRIDISDELARFQIRPDSGVVPFQPGQYVALGLGYWEPRVAGSQLEEVEEKKLRKLVRRAYSIACPILDDTGQLAPCDTLDYLEFYIVLVRQADKPPALTPRLFTLRDGDRISVEKKIVGHYVLSGIQPKDPVFFFATGTGEAPHNSMLTSLLAAGHQGPIVNATCVRKRCDLGYLQIHQALMEKYPNYHYYSYTTREPENMDGTHLNFVGKQYLQSEVTSGRLEEVCGASLSSDHAHVFLCGNPEMIGYEPPGSTPLRTPGMIQILEKRGFRHDGDPGPGLIRFEKYW